jgi:hypothetical protein
MWDRQPDLSPVFSFRSVSKPPSNLDVALPCFRCKAPDKLLSNDVDAFAVASYNSQLPMNTPPPIPPQHQLPHTSQPRRNKTLVIVLLVVGVCGIGFIGLIALVLGPLLFNNLSGKRSSSVDAQAITQARQHFESVWVKHGEIWYTVNGGKLLAAKGISFEVRPHAPLTEADRLNQLEWSGVVDCRASASCARLLSSKGGWNPWETGLQLYAGDGVGLEHYEGTTSYQIEKRGGQWRIVSLAFESARRPSSEQLPKEKM